MSSIQELKKFAENLKVLYVEDEEDIQFETGELLKRFFSVVDLASNGEEGLEKYKKSNYDLIISDISMPKMNGIEMLSSIKKINEDQKVIITSAHNEPKYLMKLIDIGVDRFVLKPFDQKKFLGALYKLSKFIYNEQHNEALEKQAVVLEKEIDKKSAQTQSLVDLIEHGIILMDEEHVSQANKHFLKMANRASANLLPKNISSLFKKQKDYLSASSNKEFIEKILANDHEHIQNKVIIKHDKHESFYLVKCKKVDEYNDENKNYIISFTDVTGVEGFTDINKETGLPSSYGISTEIERRLEDKEEFKITLLSIENIDKMIKWHGKHIKKEVDKNISNIFISHKAECEDNGIFVGYYGSNKFVLMYDKSLEEKIGFFINEISKLSTSDNANEEKIQQKNIPYRVTFGSSIIKKNTNTDSVVKMIETSFDKLNV